MKQGVVLACAAVFLFTATAAARLTGGSDAFSVVGSGVTETSTLSGPSRIRGSSPRPTRRSSGSTGSELVTGDDQVRRRPDRVLPGRRGRVRGHEPVRHRQAARRQRGRGRRLRPARRRRSPAGSAPPSARRCRALKIGQTFTTVYGGVSAQVPGEPDLRPCSACPASPRCRRTRSSSRSTTTRGFIGATSVWPSARRLDHRRLERRRSA